MPSAVSTLTDDLLKYYQHVTRAVLGDDPQLMKVSFFLCVGGEGIGGLQSGAHPSASLQVALQDLQSNSKIAALLPYFVYVVSGVSALGFFFWGGGGAAAR